MLSKLFLRSKLRSNWGSTFLYRWLSHVTALLLLFKSCLIPIFGSDNVTVILVHLSDWFHRILKRFELVKIIITVSVNSRGTGFLVKAVLLCELVWEHVWGHRVTLADRRTQELCWHLEGKVGLWFILRGWWCWSFRRVLITRRGWSIRVYIRLCSQVYRQISWTFRLNRCVCSLFNFRLDKTWRWLHPWLILHHWFKVMRIWVSLKLIILLPHVVLVDEDGLVDKLLHRVGQVLRGLRQLIYALIQRAVPALLWTLAKRALQVYRLAHWR